MATSLSEPSPVVAKLSGFLSQKPTNFEITILPIAVPDDDDDVDDNGTYREQETDATMAQLKKKKRGKKSMKKLSLDQSLLLIDGQHLGLDARSLPWMTQEIRAEYRRLRSSAKTCSTNEDDKSDEDMLTVTSCLLLVNPDHATAWADRRRSLLRQTQSLTKQSSCPNSNPANPSKLGQDAQLWARELDFLNLLMTQHSKAPSSWGHRKYVLKTLLRSVTSSSSAEDRKIGERIPSCNRSVEEVIRGEIALCRSVAEKFPKNYYAWTHRRYLWSVSRNAANSPVAMLVDEWKEMVDQWLPLHISDHSGVHYAAQILALWMEETSASQTSDKDATDGSLAPALERIAVEALARAKELVDRHSEHETLWILRRMVVRILWGYGAQSKKIAALVEEHVQQVADTMTPKSGTKANMESTSSKTHESSTTLVHSLSFLAWIDRTCRNDEMNITEWRNPGMTMLKESTRVEVFETLKDHPCVHHRFWIACPLRST